MKERCTCWIHEPGEHLRSHCVPAYAPTAGAGGAVWQRGGGLGHPFPLPLGGPRLRRLSRRRVRAQVMCLCVCIFLIVYLSSLPLAPPPPPSRGLDLHVVAKRGRCHWPVFDRTHHCSASVWYPPPKKDASSPHPSVDVAECEMGGRGGFRKHVFGEPSSA